MKDLLDKISEFRKKATQGEVDQLIATLGETTSIPVLEEVLKYYKAKEREILSGDLLEWMQENDLTTFETDDYKITISTYVSAKVTEPEVAFKWLGENGYSDLIKDSLDFPKGEFTPEVEQRLAELGVSYTKKSGIHPQSLKKIMSDRLSSGDPMPVEDDGVVVSYYDEAKVKEK